MVLDSDRSRLRFGDASGVGGSAASLLGCPGGRWLMRDADYEANYARSRALPMFGEGDIPPERDRSISQDDSGFKDVLLLLLRSWPYIRPQLLGRWWYPGRGVDDRVADLVSGGGYQFGYAPFLVALAAALGPLSGWMPATLDWPMSLLYVPVVAMTVCHVRHGVLARSGSARRHDRPVARRHRHQRLGQCFHRGIRVDPLWRDGDNCLHCGLDAAVPVAARPHRVPRPSRGRISSTSTPSTSSNDS